MTRDAVRRLHDPALDAAAHRAVWAGYRARARRIEAMISGDVDQRLLAVVADLAERFGTVVGSGSFVALPLRRRDLAAMVGAKPETASRVLSRLEKEGVLRSRRDGIWVSASVVRPVPR
jgi:CRP-like cAMP-binding protein